MFFVVVGTQTQLYQLLKVPVLVQHYFEHKQANHNISLTQFLLMHYAKKGHELKDKDDSRDMQLPYKVVNAHTLVVECIPVQWDIHLHPAAPEAAERSYSLHHESYRHTLNQKIWQPPRAC